MRLAWVLLVLALAGPARADDPDFLAFGAGGFDVNDDESTFQGRIEYRSDHRLLIVRPMAGVMATGDAGFYGYGGVLLDLFFGRRWVMTPSFAVGGYVEGGGKDLGGILEFRSAIEIAYRLDNRARLGLAFDHISNASLYDENPGTESLVLIYAIPLD
ncbi:MAG: acyloxyacyl hydrolase [Alphaproteobacteria bacterium]|nr:acyloxyacyl hydrolase [Alphaproteobacteria bacterium]